jgi:hypothetical protein
VPCLWTRRSRWQLKLRTEVSNLKLLDVRVRGGSEEKYEEDHRGSFISLDGVVATEDLPEHASTHLSLPIGPYALVCDGIPTSPACAADSGNRPRTILAAGVLAGHPIRRQGERGNYPHQREQCP